MYSDLDDIYFLSFIFPLYYLMKYSPFLYGRVNLNKGILFFHFQYQNFKVFLMARQNLKVKYRVTSE